MSTPILTARRNLAQRIGKLLLNGGEVNLTPWQLRQVRGAIEQLEEERFAEGERAMSEAERPDLYEPAGFAAKESIERQQLVGQWPRWLRRHRAEAVAPACTVARPHAAACC